ncbi:MAG: hypothetical protein ACON46_00990 [Coraliomargaritaceae bacterium]
MSQNKKPAFYVAIALSALIFIPLLLWLVAQPFRSTGVQTSPPTSVETGNGYSGNNTDFALRKLSERAQELLDGPLADAAQSGDLSLDTVLSVRKANEKATSAMASGKAKKATEIFQQVIETSEGMLATIEQAKRARERLESTYQRLEKMEPLESSFPTSYAEAVATFDRGQNQLANNLYPQSIESFQQVEKRLDELSAQSLEQVKIELEKAKRALEQYDLAAARQSYQSVFNLSPAHPDALAGMALIDSLAGIAEEVKELDRLEEAGQLEAASKRIAQLLSSNPGNAYLVKRQKMLEETIAERKFTERVEQADQAEASGNLSEAVALLESALKIKADPKTELRIQALKEKVKTKRLELLLADGFRALQSGRYEAARDAYKNAVALAPKSEEARTGYEKASGLLLASIRYSQNLENAAKYIEAGRYPLAAKFFNKAMAARPVRLTSSEESLEEKIRTTIERESVPIDVRIVSDDKTFVSMIGVFPPEKIKNKELSLYPDVYQIKGTRKGYRTIEKTIQINSSLGAKEIQVQCSEKE